MLICSEKGAIKQRSTLVNSIKEAGIEWTKLFPVLKRAIKARQLEALEALTEVPVENYGVERDVTTVV